MSTIRRLLDRCTIALFCAVLVAPAVDLFVRDDELRSPIAHERRMPAPPARFAL